MTILFILPVLLCMVFIDAAALKRENGSLYLKTIRFSPLSWIFLVALLFIAVIPVYLLRRRQFKRALQLSKDALTAESGIKEVYLITDATGIVMTWIFIVLFVTLIIEGLLLFFPIFA